MPQGPTHRGRVQPNFILLSSDRWGKGISRERLRQWTHQFKVLNREAWPALDCLIRNELNGLAPRRKLSENANTFLDKEVSANMSTVSNLRSVPVFSTSALPSSG